MPPRSVPRRRGTSQAPLSPVLLLGAGTGEATCGILYLASYLRRHGVEAFVRLTDPDDTTEALTDSLERLVAHVRPRVVGLSLKWFHHLGRARLVAQLLRRIDPTIRVVLGGNTAAWFWRELSAWDCVDDVVLGDGERPLLGLCRGEEDVPNVVTRGKKGPDRPTALGYVQDEHAQDIHYSHFPQLFLSELDRRSYSGWIAPGKGCAENCLYCGGARGVQKASFGRATEFVRPLAAVQRDHHEVAPHTWQLRYDFSGGTAAFLRQAWAGTDLSRHSVTYFLWGVPPPELVEALAQTFARVFLVLDVGCFAESQRLELQRRGLLKPCPTDRQLQETLAVCRRFPNLELEVSGIAGLPFLTPLALKQEQRFVERLLGEGLTPGYQRLEAQPGALVTEHPARFAMHAEARTFAEFLSHFSQGDPAFIGEVPMLRFLDPGLEAAVQAGFEALDQRIHDAAQARRAVRVGARTRIVSGAAARDEVPLGTLLGTWRVPPRLAREPVTMLRGPDGAGLALAPGVDPRRFSDASLQQGEDAALILAAMDAFAQPAPLGATTSRLARTLQVEPALLSDLLRHLLDARLLRPA